MVEKIGNAMAREVAYPREEPLVPPKPRISNPVSTVEKCFKPTAKQQEVLGAPDSIFEILGGGAAGGGKTDIGVLLPCIRQFTEHPKYKGLMMRRTHPDIEKEIVPRQHEWFSQMGAVYHETKKRWKFPSGAIIQNGHAEREQDVRKYDSAEYNTIVWDESTHFTGFQYLYLSFTRCRSSSPDLPAFVRSFTNPGNIGHQFFKKRFIDPCPFGNKIIVDKTTKVKRLFVPFLGKDNPYLLVNDPSYLSRLESLPEVEKRAKLYGDWNSYEGQVFSEFRVFHLADEPENACHVIHLERGKEGYELDKLVPDWWPKILCIDWGWTAMTFAIWAAISPSGRLYIYRTWAWNKTAIKIWGRELANISKVGTPLEEKFEDVVICHSAGQHRGEEKTIREQIIEAFDDKYAVRLGDKDRIGGKNMIHEYLRWKEKARLNLPVSEFDTNLANRILRMQGEEKYYEYLNIFKPIEPEDNIPKLQILSHGPEGRENKELIDVIPACIPSEINPEDVADFDGDDPYEALRLAVKCAHRYIDESKEELARRKKLQALHEKAQVHTTEAQTAYYRNLELLADRSEMDGEEIYAVRGHRRLGSRRFHLH
jgi:hypothetical protein